MNVFFSIICFKFYWGRPKQFYTSYRLSSIHKKQDGFSQQKAIYITKCIKFLWMNKMTCDLKLDG